MRQLKHKERISKQNTLGLVGCVFFHKLILTKSCYSCLKSQLLITRHFIVTVPARRSRARGRDHCNRQVKRQKRKMSMRILNSFFKWWENVDVQLTRGAQYVKYEACQHEGQNRSIVAEVSITELLCAVPYGSHFNKTQRNLLQQSHHLWLLICQLHLTQEHSISELWHSKCFTGHVSKHWNAFLVCRQFQSVNLAKLSNFCPIY